jgi:thiol-disulfide isomerase/thioredoxin
MKDFLFSFLILCPLCLSFGQSHPTAPALLKQDSAYIKGQIILSGEKPASVTFFVVDYLLGIERPEHASVDAEGRFEIRFFIRNTHQVTWRYGERRNQGTLILSPGDSLTVIATDNEVKLFGKNAAPSEDYHHIRTQKEWSAYYYALDTGYRLEPEVYLEFRKQHYKKDLKFLDSYCLTRACSGLFKKWYSTDAEVRYFNDLMAYSWKSENYGLGSPVRLTGERKEKYNAAYLGDIDPNDSTYAISKWYTFFLIGYSQKVEKRIPHDQIQKVVYVAKLNALLDIIGKEIPKEVNEMSANKIVLERLLERTQAEDTPDSADIKTMWKLSEEYELPLQRAMAKWYTDLAIETTSSIHDQRVRELRFLHSFVREIEVFPNLDDVYQRMLPLIKTQEYRELLTNEYNRQKEEDKLIDNNQHGIQVLRKDYDRSADQILSGIVKANQNKVIVIDFWATWCAPCLDDFTITKPIKEKIPADSISYVYLCSQSSRDLWLKQIKKYSLKGQHYFLSDTQYSEFQKRFGLKAFPTYIVVDAKKKIYKDISLWDMREEKRFMEKLQGIMARDN